MKRQKVELDIQIVNKGSKFQKRASWLIRCCLTNLPNFIKVFID